MPNVNEDTIVKPKVEARQGVTGHNVRYVLGFSLTGAAVALAIVLLIFFG